MQEPIAGRRIVSKGAYARLIGRKVGLVIVGATCILLMAAGLYILPSMFRSGIDLFKSGSGLLLATWYFLTGCAALVGFYLLARDVKKILSTSLRKEPVVPLTRANTAALSANDSLVRASQEPMQPQEGVLLRAASGEAQAGPEEQLLRASVGGRE